MTFGDRQAEQTYFLIDHRLTRFAIPIRIVVRSLDEMSSERLNPTWLNPRDTSGISPVGFDQFRSNDPFRFLKKGSRTWPKLQFQIVRPGVFIESHFQRDIR